MHISWSFLDKRKAAIKAVEAFDSMNFILKHTDEEISAVLTEISLSVCKAYKEIPGLPEGKFDRDAIFRELVGK